MYIVCISASNIKHAKDNSTSLNVCKLIKSIVEDFNDEVECEVISLVGYELKPCIGCGACFMIEECPCDNEFNEIYRKVKKANGIFIVSAHYAPIPAKLSMLLEKIEQLAFLKRFNNENYRSPLYKIPAGIVGHGGGTEDIIEYYKSPVIDSIWNALSYPVEMNIVGIDGDYPRGIVFPVKRVIKKEDSIFPIQEYDWNDIRRRLSILVNKVIEKVGISYKE